ncbi:CYTH domain-containing protein [Desulfomonile tiedjei]|nr:CYTH domain-containing protein [Desulfomonile tiedjei]
MEHEITLIICSENPDAVMDSIEFMGSFGEYRLVPSSASLIEDRYFDTRARVLRSAHWALRLRKTQGNHLLTLKGPSRTIGNGIHERFELELSWSRKALEKVLTEIVRNGLASPDLSRITSDPVQAMEAAGFEIVQTRETSRRILNVRKSADSEVLAELVLDKVLYQFEIGTILHHEMELESKSESGILVIGTIMTHLTKIFRREIREWPHSKLATGWAYEKLLKQEPFAPARLSPAERCDKLDATLRLNT